MSPSNLSQGFVITAFLQAVRSRSILEMQVTTRQDGTSSHTAPDISPHQAYGHAAADVLELLSTGWSERQPDQQFLLRKMSQPAEHGGDEAYCSDLRAHSLLDCSNSNRTSMKTRATILESTTAPNSKERPLIVFDRRSHAHNFLLSAQYAHTKRCFASGTKNTAPVGSVCARPPRAATLPPKPVPLTTVFDSSFGLP